MKLIGVTGGVGAGKSQVLGYIRDTYKARILLADEAANDLKKPGMPCYEPVIATPVSYTHLTLPTNSLV